MANISQLASAALSEGGGIFRLAPTWVPRSFLQPGRRLKLHPDDYYALGMDRGGIDERWFGSTTVAANENAPPDEGLSYCVFGKERFILRYAIEIGLLPGRYLVDIIPFRHDFIAALEHQYL